MTPISERELLARYPWIGASRLRSLAKGVFIEDNGTDERKPSDRCFRFDANGNAEYALFADLTGSNPAPRWFGHQFRERYLPRAFA